MTTTPLTAEDRAELRRLCDEQDDSDFGTLTDAVPKLLDMLDSVERERDVATRDAWNVRGELADTLDQAEREAERRGASFVKAQMQAREAYHEAGHKLIIERDSLRAQLAAVTKERDDARDMAREAQIHNDRMTALSTVADKTLQLATMVATSNAAERDTAKAQLATATAKLAAYDIDDNERELLTNHCLWLRHGLKWDSDATVLVYLHRVLALDALPAPSKGVPDGE